MLRKVLHVLSEYAPHVNESKLKMSKKQISFLDYDFVPGSYSLESYVGNEKDNFPRVSSRKEIRKVLGIFHLVRMPCLDLALWVRPLQKYSKDGVLPDVMNLRKETNQIWEKRLRACTRLCLEKGPKKASSDGGLVN